MLRPASLVAVPATGPQKLLLAPGFSSMHYFCGYGGKLGRLSAPPSWHDRTQLSSRVLVRIPKLLQHGRLRLTGEECLELSSSSSREDSSNSSSWLRAFDSQVTNETLPLGTPVSDAISLTLFPCSVRSTICRLLTTVPAPTRNKRTAPRKLDSQF